MNLLTDQLPTAVEIDGRVYAINTDFRACLRVILAYEDGELTSYEKQLVLLENLYAERPHDLAEAVRVGMRFLNGGREQGEDDNGGPRLYSFQQDAGFIYAAFRQTHGVDLEIETLHWWKFLTLFMDLGGETTFCNLVSLRKRVKTGKATKDELRAYREMRDVVDLPEPDTRTSAEREQELEFLRLVEEGKRKREEQKTTA